MADSGHLESDLPEVFLALAGAAQRAGTPVALFIDEVQYLSQGDLAALITSVHKVGQKGLPFVVFGAGLPQLAALAGEAKSYAEGLFNYPDVGPLSSDAASDAIREPVRREGVEITEDALAMIVESTKGHAYFIQEWGHHTWNVATHSPITSDDVKRATAVALTQLDAEFFRVRLDRLTPKEKEYMRAMAQLGPGPHRSGEIAQILFMNVTKAAPLRNGLIKKGMIFSPQHGDTSFTVPMFDEFMRRSMPDWAPSAAKPRGKRRRDD
jgi:DNA-binding CsgD family transcriptional regulator